MMVIENKFEIGQTVYLLTDKEQQARLVTGIRVCPNCLLYCLSFGTVVSDHYDFEISAEENILIKT